MINFYSVRNHLEESGWSLTSEEYINLESPLKMKCPKGHEQEKSYGEWRKRQICEQCLAGDPYKIKQKQVPEKKEGVDRVLALDAATIDSGYALYDGNQLVTFGVFHVDSRLPVTERINKVKQWMLTAIEEWKPDFVGIEHIQLQVYRNQDNGAIMRQVETYRVLANLQGVLLDALFEANIPSDLVISSVWREYCGVGGRDREAKKRAAQSKVLSWYNLGCTQDEADAICIGKYFVGRRALAADMWGESFD